EDKNVSAARSRLESILRKDSGNVQAYMMLARLGPQLGEAPKQRIAWLEAARKADPDALAPSLALAKLHGEMGTPLRSLEVLQAARASHPDDPNVLEQLGMVQMAVGQVEQGLATL